MQDEKEIVIMTTNNSKPYNPDGKPSLIFNELCALNSWLRRNDKESSADLLDVALTAMVKVMIDLEETK